jgi:pimeloyl-ACP methyl ester carboxylesterase
MKSSLAQPKGECQRGWSFRCLTLAIAAVAISAVCASGAHAADARPAKGNERVLKQPLAIADQGSFFVNGHLTLINYPCATIGPRELRGYCQPGHMVTGQMYVRYQVPKKQRPGGYPIVLVHGGSHSGATYETTPDGREGWDTIFLRLGYPVYIVDWPGRARSSFNPDAINQAQMEKNATLLPASGQRAATIESAWHTFRFGPEYPTQFPNPQFPFNVLNQYLAQLVINTEADKPDALVDALAALLDRIGPAIVLTHSASGPSGYQLVARRSNLVKGLVSAEPGGTACSADTDAASFKATPALTFFGDFTDNHPFWSQKYNECKSMADRIKAAGGDAVTLKLPSVGIFGNSHMLMMEKNNVEIAEWIDKWLRVNVAKRSVRK